MLHRNRSVELVEIARISGHGSDLQPREALDASTVSDYAQRMSAGDIFPPVLVFFDGTALWLADGYHRLAAARSCGKTSIVAEVKQGSRDDASWAACAANLTHGLRRSNKDKQRSVLRALGHEKGRSLSDRQIARHCGVHHHTVGRLRKRLEDAGAIDEVAQRLVRRGASVYVQKVAGICDSNAKRSLDEAATAPRLARAAAVDARPRRVSGAAAVPTAAGSPQATTITSIRALMESAEQQLSSLAHEVAGGGTEVSWTQLPHLRRALRQLREASESLACASGDPRRDVQPMAEAGGGGG